LTAGRSRPSYFSLLSEAVISTPTGFENPSHHRSGRPRVEPVFGVPAEKGIFPSRIRTLEELREMVKLLAKAITLTPTIFQHRAHGQGDPIIVEHQELIAEISACLKCPYE